MHLSILEDSEEEEENDDYDKIDDLVKHRTSTR